MLADAAAVLFQPADALLDIRQLLLRAGFAQPGDSFSRPASKLVTNRAAIAASLVSRPSEWQYSRTSVPSSLSTRYSRIISFDAVSVSIAWLRSN
jgi:hypothetical protein